MKKILLSAVTAALIVTASASQASWFGGNDGPWGGNGWGNDWNPYDEWDPRYWIREMDSELADDDYGPPPGYYGGYGPGYGQGYGPGYGGYGPGSGGYGPGYGYGGPAPYGPPQGYAPQQYAPQQYAPQQYAPQQAPQGYAPQR
ncbi:MAG: sulfur globule protein CV1 [Gammaproteobacteria bacterium]|nr:sulfur globule protein CV1 [Gammaproteobacteria bacterium]